MNKIYKNENGFSAVELVIVIVILVLVAIVGFLVYKNQHKSSLTNLSTSSAKTSTSSFKNSTQANPYTGWSLYKTQYQKLIFKYPTGWILTDNTNAQGNGNDYLGIKSPSGFDLTLQALVPIGAAGSDATLVKSDPITFLGNNDYIDYYSSATVNNNAKLGTIDSATLSTNSSKLLFQNTHSSDGSIWDISMTSSNSVLRSEISSNIDYQNAILILKSATY